jgi:oligopeptide/dipeptide ABC transporter ATP-binding protein
MTDHVLQVDGLQVFFDTEEGTVRAVDGVSFAMRRGRIMALVGESGCGKSVTSYSILRLIQKPGRIAGGSMVFRPRGGEPVDLASLTESDKRLYLIRGGQIAMIFQEPMTALSPVHTVANQMIEAVRTHQAVSKAEARQRAIDMLARVGIPNPQRRIDQYPFEMSGGMRQRVVIAMAMVCDPQVLIADEPTTALDVTIQAQVMALMKKLQRDMGTSILLITHDLGVVAQMADDVAVMYLGRIVEQGTVRQVLRSPRHPYTMGLLASLPSLAVHGSRLASIEGSVPSLTSIPPGCPFHPRCPHARAGLCDAGPPPALIALGDGRGSACLRVADLPQTPMQEASHG